MQEPAKTPTLLVFTLGPECERLRHRSLPSPLRQAAAWVHLHGLGQTIDAGRRAGYRVVVSSPETLDLPPQIEQIGQPGRGFADRLRRAMRMLQTTYTDAPLLVVGTDTPDLTADHLRSAVALLDESVAEVVLGPSHDGGFYLLATRVDLDSELAQIRWCRDDTRACLEACLERSGRRIRLLDSLRDLDDYTDLELWLSTDAVIDANSWLRRHLSRLLATWRRPAAPSAIGSTLCSLAAAASGRAPPL